MNTYLLQDEFSINEFNAYVNEEAPVQLGLTKTFEGLELKLTTGDRFIIEPRLLSLVNLPKAKYDPIIYGKNGLENVVGAEVEDNHFILFLEKDGKITETYLPNQNWVMSAQNYSDKFTKLDGFRHYKYIKYYKTLEEWNTARKKAYQFDLYSVYCPVESNLMTKGITFFKNTEIKDVSVLSFDIETDGLARTAKSDVYLISNTFRDKNQQFNKLFDIHDYKNAGEMLADWGNWVREVNPSIMLGHNIYGYDLPYMDHVARSHGSSISIGRNGSNLGFNDYDSKFRKDQEQFYTYRKPLVWGRQMIDTFFLSLKYDIATKKYDSYGLKAIIKAEGLEAPGRQHYDAGTIKNHLNNKEEWAKIKSYAISDAEDALKLFDLMAPSFFYSTQMIPKSFEAIINGATGSQLNSILVRSYLQDGGSIPKASATPDFQGAISKAKPGLYKNLLRWDVASLYPSIMKEYEIYSKSKDPKKHMLYTLTKILDERLMHKKLAKETGNPYHEGMQGALKILANSYYGFQSAPGLNFNNPEGAALITQKGREILSKAIFWASGKTVEEIYGFGKDDELDEQTE